MPTIIRVPAYDKNRKKYMSALQKFAIALTLVCGILFYSGDSYSQDKVKASETNEDQKDLIDVITELLGKKRSLPDTTDNGRSLNISFLPGVSYSTSTGFLIGFNLSMSRLYGPSETTTPSAATLSSNYTSKKQFNIKLKSDFFTSGNEWLFDGDWRYSLTSQDTYGTGTGTPASAKEVQFFDQIRIFQRVSKKITGGIFAGLGFYFDYFYNMKARNADDVELNPNHNSDYSRLFGYDSVKYRSGGIGIHGEFDTRDNVTNPYKGYYASLRHTIYNSALGSSGNWQNAYAEFRTYYSFGKVNKHVLAWWLYGSFILTGEPPYLCLPAVGWDKYERSGKGYTVGRYRGDKLMYGEFEYRFPISSNGLFGGIVFVNATTASSPESGTELFKIINPGIGAGLRIKFNKYSRSNIAIDYGRGSDGSSSLFLNLSENF